MRRRSRVGLIAGAGSISDVPRLTTVVGCAPSASSEFQHAVDDREAGVVALGGRGDRDADSRANSCFQCGALRYKAAMRLVAATVLGLALWASVGSYAAAQRDRADANAARRRARELNRQSHERYQLADYQGAVELLEQAYALYPQPILLYNMARAYGNLGRFEEAIAAYERYLASAPEGDDHRVIETRIRNYRAVLEERRAREAEARTARAAEAAETQRRAALLEARTEPRPAEPDAAPWVIAGVGAAVLIGGGVLGGLSLSERGAAESEPAFIPAQAASDRAVAFAWAANGAFILGGVLALVGVVWGIVDLTSSESARTAVSVRRGNLEIVW